MGGAKSNRALVIGSLTLIEALTPPLLLPPPPPLHPSPVSCFLYVVVFPPSLNLGDRGVPPNPSPGRFTPVPRPRSSPLAQFGLRRGEGGGCPTLSFPCPPHPPKVPAWRVGVRVVLLWCLRAQQEGGSLCTPVHVGLTRFGVLGSRNNGGHFVDFLSPPPFLTGPGPGSRPLPAGRPLTLALCSLPAPRWCCPLSDTGSWAAGGRGRWGWCAGTGCFAACPSAAWPSPASREYAHLSSSCFGAAVGGAGRTPGFSRLFVSSCPL